MNKDIINFNKKGQYHGYHEWYSYGKMSHRGNWRNNRIIGYAEWHRFNQIFFYII